MRSSYEMPMGKTAMLCAAPRKYGRIAMLSSPYLQRTYSWHVSCGGMSGALGMQLDAAPAARALGEELQRRVAVPDDRLRAGGACCALDDDMHTCTYSLNSVMYSLSWLNERRMKNAPLLCVTGYRCMHSRTSRAAGRSPRPC